MSKAKTNNDLDVPSYVSTTKSSLRMANSSRFKGTPNSSDYVPKTFIPRK